jgi:hypothetical protein
MQRLFAGPSGLPGVPQTADAIGSRRLQTAPAALIGSSTALNPPRDCSRVECRRRKLIIAQVDVLAGSS